MGNISVRIDDEIEKQIGAMARERGISKSEIVRSLLYRGFDRATSNTAQLNQHTALLQENISLTQKAIKSSVQSLAFARRILGHLNTEYIPLAIEDAQRILAQNGLDE